MKSGLGLIVLMVAVLLAGVTAHAGCITVTSPNGGENLALGSTYNITWTNTCSKVVKIELRKDGVVLGIIATNLPATQNSYQWRVGDYPGGTASTGSGYKILIITTDLISWDRSDGCFSIVEMHASHKIRVKAYENVDLKLERVYSDSCPHGEIIEGSDSFYMSKIIVRVRRVTNSLMYKMPEFRVRVAYFDMNTLKSQMITRDFKPESSTGPIEVLSTPVLAKKSFGVKVAVIPLGRYVDNNMGNNTITVHKCNTYEYNPTGDMQQHLQDLIQNFHTRGK